MEGTAPLDFRETVCVEETAVVPVTAAVVSLVVCGTEWAPVVEDTAPGFPCRGVREEEEEEEEVMVGPLESRRLAFRSSVRTEETEMAAAGELVGGGGRAGKTAAMFLCREEEEEENVLNARSVPVVLVEGGREGEGEGGEGCLWNRHTVYVGRKKGIIHTLASLIVTSDLVSDEVSQGYRSFTILTRSNFRRSITASSGRGRVSNSARVGRVPLPRFLWTHNLVGEQLVRGTALLTELARQPFLPSCRERERERETHKKQTSDPKTSKHSHKLSVD